MAAKQLLFGQDARDSMRRGVDALAGAVKVALGPRGRTVILEHEFGPPRIVDSGVVVAGSVRALEEPLRRIVGNAAEEPSIVPHRADETGATQEVPAATGVGAQPQVY